MNAAERRDAIAQQMMQAYEGMGGGSNPDLFRIPGGSRQFFEQKGPFRGLPPNVNPNDLSKTLPDVQLPPGAEPRDFEQKLPFDLPKAGANPAMDLDGPDVGGAMDPGIDEMQMAPLGGEEGMPDTAVVAPSEGGGAAPGPEGIPPGLAEELQRRFMGSQGGDPRVSDRDMQMAGPQTMSGMDPRMSDRDMQMQQFENAQRQMMEAEAARPPIPMGGGRQPIQEQPVERMPVPNIPRERAPLSRMYGDPRISNRDMEMMMQMQGEGEPFFPEEDK